MLLQDVSESQFCIRKYPLLPLVENWGHENLYLETTSNDIIVSHWMSIQHLQLYIEHCLQG